MATIRKRNNIWRAEICRLGVPLSGSFHTKAQAVTWATQKEAEIIAGKDLAWTDMTVAETFRRYAQVVSPSKHGARWEVFRIEHFWSRFSGLGRTAAT